MLLSSLNLLLMSNAVTTRRDKSILYSRVAIIILLYSVSLRYNLKDIANSLVVFKATAPPFKYLIAKVILVISSPVAYPSGEENIFEKKQNKVLKYNDLYFLYNVINGARLIQFLLLFIFVPQE